MPARAAAIAAAVLAALILTTPAHGRAVTIQADVAHGGNAGDAGLRGRLARRWVHRVRGRPGYAVIAGGRVFVPVMGPSRSPAVIALSVRSGRLLWQRELAGDSASAALAYDAGRVFVTRDSWADDPWSPVLALSAADGRPLWESAGAGAMFATTPPVADGGAVYVNGIGSGVTALRQSDGARLWHAPTDSGSDGSPALSADAVFAAMSSCPDVHRLNRVDGAEVWHPENGCHGGGGSVPVLHRDRLYVTESDRWPPGDVYDAGTGALVGRMRADWTPAFAGGTGVFPDARPPGEEGLLGHTLVARRLRDDRVRWRFDGDGYLDSAPLIANGTVYVGSGSGRVYGVSLRSGRVRFRARVAGPIPAPRWVQGWSGLAAAGGILVVPAPGRVIAFG
jgi:outer membrane protein assembly factor BamB